VTARPVGAAFSLTPCGALTHLMVMNRSQKSGTIEEIRLQAEKIRLDFIVSQVDTAYTLARTAQIVYRSESKSRAYRLLDKARQAYGGAVDLLQRLSLDERERRYLTGKLSELRVMLDTLPPPADTASSRDQPDF